MPDNERGYYEFFEKPHPTSTIIAYESEKPSPIIIYNHLGEALAQPKQKMGFDLSVKRDRTDAV